MGVTLTRKQALAMRNVLERYVRRLEGAQEHWTDEELEEARALADSLGILPTPTTEEAEAARMVRDQLRLC